MKKLAVVLMGAVLSLCLFGCASSTSLDRTVTVEGLTMSVPSKWVEDGSDTSYDFSDSVFGNRSFYSDDESAGLLISYSNVDKVSPEEKILKEEEFCTSDPINGTDFEYWVVEESVIDGARCSVYGYSYKMDLEASGIVEYEYRVAFIQNTRMEYEISGFGDFSVFDLAIDSVEIA